MEEYDLLQCIDKALDGYGSSVKNAIFWRMAILHNSTRNEVISDPTILARVIEETFGSSTKGIEMSIISEINKNSISRQEVCVRLLMQSSKRKDK